MARKNRSPEENARREKIRELLQMANIGSMDDIQNLFKEAIAEFMEKGLEAELDEELGCSKYDYKNKDTDNSRNGHSSKRLRTSFGEVDVSVPRDRKGEFEPQVLKKNQTSISQNIEEKILSMYAKGMTTGDIETHIQEIYGISVSDSTVSRITDKILPVAREWQQRPLESIHATFPQTEIQNCIIHQLRNSSKYVSCKDLKALMADLKAVYAAVDEQAALDALDAFEERWDKKYPKISQSWRANWANLSTCFLLKMLYLAMMDITKKWTGRRQDWSLIHAQMAIYFAGRMPE